VKKWRSDGWWQWWWRWADKWMRRWVETWLARLTEWIRELIPETGWCISKWAMWFYRATRMHSADYAVARCPSVCLSVRPSHADIESKRLYISSKFFHHQVAPTILVFPYQTGWQYSDGDPPNGGIECKGGMKKSRFSPNISLYLANDAR